MIIQEVLISKWKIKSWITYMNSRTQNPTGPNTNHTNGKTQFMEQQ